MITIDGSYLEGGGQILRTAVALSAITQQSVTIVNIRKGRKKSGLRPQHVEGIAAAARICNADVTGLAPHSHEIEFRPQKLKGGHFTIDIKTAGSVTLVMQTLIPLGIFSDRPLELTINGGTAVPFSPTTEYFSNVFSKMVKKFGVSISMETLHHGFYPVGGGKIKARIEPSTLHGIKVLERGSLELIDVLAIASRHLKETRVAERLIEGFRKLLSKARFQTQYFDVPSPGCFIRSFARFRNSVIGSDGLGERGKRAEDIGYETADRLKKEIEGEATIDEWMVDQLLPYMALAAFKTGEESGVKIPRLSKHAKTNIWVVTQFLPVHFQCDDAILSCQRV